jgi:hypothetical protein
MEAEVVTVIVITVTVGIKAMKVVRMDPTIVEKRIAAEGTWCKP